MIVATSNRLLILLAAALIVIGATIWTALSLAVTP